MVTALFVDRNGIYPKLLDNWFDADKDARNYNGIDTVVCHPPCQLWVNFASLNYKRYGGEHNRPGNDGGCFKFALDTVRMNGGVLEHPAGSKAWESFQLTKPKGIGWNKVSDNEYVCEIWQSAYGHKARKRTWLLYVGKECPSDGKWDRNPGTHQIGHFDIKKPVLSKKESSATPVEFAKWLIQIAAIA